MNQALGSPTLSTLLRFVYAACEVGKRQHIQLAIEKCDHVGSISFLPATQQFQALAALVPRNILINAQQAIFAFTYPQSVEITHRVGHRKRGKTLQSMNVLHERKACLKFGLQLLESLQLLFHQFLHELWVCHIYLLYRSS